MHLYGHPASGNVYKTQLLLGLLGRDYRQTPVKWGTPEIESEEFLALNPAGRVPVLVDGEDDDAFVLPESDAQLWYLAQGTPYWPDDARDQAQVLRWLFWEQYSHEPYLAVIRYLRHYGDPGPETQRRIEARTPGARDALDVLEGHLADRDWLVGDGPTIADLALYAYTHVAHEAGFSLDAYRAIRAWVARVEVLPGYVPLVPYETAADA